jgi:hypothetical protein
MAQRDGQRYRSNQIRQAERLPAKQWWLCPNKDTLVQDFLIPCSARSLTGTTKTQAEREMHFLTSLTVILGFTVVVGLAFVKVICDLLRISVHASPDMLAMPRRRSPQPEAERADRTEFFETSNP